MKESVKRVFLKVTNVIFVKKFCPDLKFLNTGCYWLACHILFVMYPLRLCL